MRIHPQFNHLSDEYLFSNIAQRVNEYKNDNPTASIIHLGIGDATRPLSPAVTHAMERAAGEMGRAETFRGYAGEQGYLFLRQAVSRYYASRGMDMSPEETVISDGAKSDIGNFQELFQPTALS